MTQMDTAPGLNDREPFSCFPADGGRGSGRPANGAQGYNSKSFMTESSWMTHS